MSNDIVIVEWDKTRELRFGHKAQKTFEKLTGKPISQFNPDAIGADEVEKLLYCMMLADAQRNGENLQLKDMENLLDGVSPYSEIMKAVSEVMGATMAPLEQVSTDGDASKNEK